MDEVFYSIKKSTLDNIVDALRVDTNVSITGTKFKNMPSKIREVRDADYKAGYEECNAIFISSINSLKGAVWEANGNGWEADEDYGTFQIDAEFYCSYTNERYTISEIIIGDGKNTVTITTVVDGVTTYSNYNNTYPIYLNFIGGDDVSDSDLIYWCCTNGRLIAVNSYDKGYENGHSAGYDEGNADGYSKGQTDGYNNGYFEGNQAGYAKGHSDGYNEGYTDGYDEAWASSGVDDIFAPMGIQAKNMPVDATSYANGEDDYMYPIELFEDAQFAQQVVDWDNYFDYEAVGSSSTLDITVINNTDRVLYVYIKAECEFDDALPEHRWEQFYQRMYLEPQESYSIRIYATAGGINYTWNNNIMGLRFI